MNLNRPLVLASSSPRRQYLLKEAGFTFTVRKPDVEEDFLLSMPGEQVALFLAKKKADFFRPSLSDEIIVTADTVVLLNDNILNKPADRGEAIAMLSMLSGNRHTVMTGVYILSKEREEGFTDETNVYFKKLSLGEIEFYVDQYQPFDKAGAYGAQDWIGLIAVERIEGSYFNVMGLPVHRVYEHLAGW